MDSDRWEFDLALDPRPPSAEDFPGDFSHEDFSDNEHAGGNWTFPEDNDSDDNDAGSDDLEETTPDGEPSDSNNTLESVRRWAVQNAAGAKRDEARLAETLERIQELERERANGWTS